MYLIVAYTVGGFLPSTKFGLTDFVSTDPDTAEEIKKQMIMDDLDCQEGLEEEIDRQGWEYFNIEDIEDDKLKEIAKDIYSVYMIKIEEI